jgi:predicted nucleic acid-binding protein
MSVTKVLLDTNILIYIFSKDEHEKRKQTISRVNNYERFVSTQILPEFCSVSIRKLKMDTLQVDKAINEICWNTGLIMVDLATVKLGIYIKNKYHYSYYDSLIIASALESNCEFLLSEDMNRRHE